MRRHAACAIKVARAVVCAVFLLSAAGAGAWYLALTLEGRNATADLESRWREHDPSRTPQSLQPGDVVGRIIVPRIDLNAPLVEMADVDDRENLNKGPAHLAGSALPGRPGNCVIAGHRTTYSRPFFSLDALREGDTVVLVDLSRANYEYEVTQLLVVKPDEVWVMDPTPEPSVTLIACHPRFSARSRIVVKAVLRDQGQGGT